jgi:hypothetical protein
LGKFTNSEAETLIEQLEGSADEVDLDDGVPTVRVDTARPLRDTPTDELVAELKLRGWDGSAY